MGHADQATGGDSKRDWKATADYDGDQLLCELDAAGRVTRTSTWGANGLVAKARTTYDAQGAPSTMGLLYAFDERGNTVNVVNQYGGLEDNSAFDAIGGRVWGRNDSTGFGGQWGYYTDGETGLILCTQRYYDPAAQRWVTRDPIGFSGGINLYGYVQNNPMNQVDPQGHMGWALAGGGSLGGLVETPAVVSAGLGLLSSPAGLGVTVAIGGYAAGTVIERHFDIARSLIPDEMETAAAIAWPYPAPTLPSLPALCAATKPLRDVLKDNGVPAGTITQLPGKIRQELSDWEIDPMKFRQEIQSILDHYKNGGMSAADLSKAKKILTDQDLADRVAGK